MKTYMDLLRAQLYEDCTPCFKAQPVAKYTSYYCQCDGHGQSVCVIVNYVKDDSIIKMDCCNPSCENKFDVYVRFGEIFIAPRSINELKRLQGTREFGWIR